MKKGLQIHNKYSQSLKKMSICLSSSLMIAGSAHAMHNLKAHDLNWTGFHLAGSAGFGMFNENHYVEDSIPITARQTSGGQGGLVRVGLGYNYQWLPCLVIGAFADYDFMNIYGRVAFPGVVGNGKQSHAWYLGGLLGYKITPLTMFLIDAGYTNTHFNRIDYFLATSWGGPTGLNRAHHNFDGGFLGFGMETWLASWKSSNFFLRTEYRYAYYGVEHVPLGGTAGNGIVVPAGIDEHIRVATQTVTATINWAFRRRGH